jgi:hypothetical protein
MLDSRLIQGLLIAACVSLLFGITMTWVDIQAHDVPETALGPLPGAPSPQQAAPQEPAPAEPQPETEAEGESALRNAPAGTWGVVSVNVQRLLASAIAQQQQQRISQQLPGASPDAVERLTFFGIGTDPQSASACGIISLKAGTRGEVEGALAEEGESVTVAGREAYKVTRQPAAMGVPGGQAQAQTALLAFADDTTVLFGNDEGALQAVADAFGSQQQVDPTLSELSGRFADAAIHGAAVIPQPMANQLRQQVPANAQYLRGLHAVATGIDLTQDIDLDALARFEQAAQASEASSALQEQIDQMKQQAQADPQIQQMMQPLLAVLDKVKLGTDGADLNVNANLTQQDVQNLMGGMLMMMMSAGGQGGPGMPAR